MRTLDLRRRGNRQTGFTLLEVLIAMGILAVVGTFIALTLNRSNTTLHESQTLSDAQVVANNVVEDIRGKVAAGQQVCSGTRASPQTVNGVTYHPVVTITPVKVSKGGAQDVACNNATAIKVNVDVQWQGQGKSGTLKSPVSTMLNLVKLTAPQLRALKVYPKKIAAGQTLTATWTEPGTLPVPQYSLSQPANSKPTTLPTKTVTFQGPRVNVQKQALADAPNAELTVQATGDPKHDRTYTLTFQAARNGVHTFSARNIVGNAVATANVNTVMKPALKVTPAQQAIDYYAKPTWDIQTLYTGNDADTYITIGEPGNVTTTYKSPHIHAGDPLDVSQVPARVATFPVTYPITIHNLWTKTYNTQVTQSLTVTCKKPTLTIDAQPLLSDRSKLLIKWAVDTHQAPFTKVVLTLDGNPVTVPPSQQAPQGSASTTWGYGSHTVTAYAVSACNTGPAVTKTVARSRPQRHTSSGGCSVSRNKTYDNQGGQWTGTKVTNNVNTKDANKNGISNIQTKETGVGDSSGWDGSGTISITVTGTDRNGNTVTLCHAEVNGFGDSSSAATTNPTSGN